MTLREKVASEIISSFMARPEYFMADAVMLADRILALVAENRRELVEALERLARKAEQAEARVKVLEEALDEYGEHRRGCHKVYRHDTGDCACGLDAALAGKEASGE